MARGQEHCPHARELSTSSSAPKLPRLRSSQRPSGTGSLGARARACSAPPFCSGGAGQRATVQVPQAPARAEKAEERADVAESQVHMLRAKSRDAGAQMRWGLSGTGGAWSLLAGFSSLLPGGHSRRPPPHLGPHGPGSSSEGHSRMQSFPPLMDLGTLLLYAEYPKGPVTLSSPPFPVPRGTAQEAPAFWGTHPISRGLTTLFLQCTKGNYAIS